MTRGQHRVRRKAAPQGTWLAFLALAIQVLLPFFVAYEIALASTPAYAEGTTVICSASGSTASPAPHQVDHTAHHGVAGSCPLCIALAASQAFTAAAPVALPLPQAKSVILHNAVQAPRVFSGATLSYNSRAPPFIG